ncbi:NADP-dependent oxidoreductase [Haloactinomyces albus]|uniref:NADPH:quinone reductase-like Zn-dependent oxidoreductase n=1 Tax=Haloactinomyces albus TaxID=1352928 RepID=A0AAE3ZC93_9ACTN|nr:NADP-dependent oxidoreductase [Haloactinomyces albus]MDR7302256.1 NADPH:quinone reductase-like Zn-dependent oxidoreductase [Haloactinomyces albus]
MKAVGVTEFGGPEALHEVELPERHAGPGEMRIRVHAATVNPTDTVARNGDRARAQRKNPPPYVPGMDAAGILEEIGDGVDTDLAVDEHVMAIVVPTGSHGAYAEQIVVPAGSVARVPAGADDVTASTLPMNGLTARKALDVLELRAGQTIAVTGAAGSFGGYVVQLAKSEGLRVVADASPADKDLVSKLGADIVVDRGEDVAERIRAAVPEGVDGLADGAVLDHRVIGAVRDGGRIATVRGFSGEPERDVTYHPVWVVDYAQEQAKLDRLRAQAENGELTLRVADSFPAEQAPEAHRRLEAGGTRGRLVLRF